MGKQITSDDIKQAAASLGCEEAAVKAVLAVEAAGAGFLPDGRPKILFEGHVFYRELIARGEDVAPLCKEYPSLVYPKWTKANYSTPVGEWNRLTVARSINNEAALSSASWGLFQIMGNNHRACGHTHILNFVEAMQESEGKQLAAFVAFVKNSGLARFLVAKEWAGFARGYNGPGYAANKYDAKLAAAYAKARG